MLDLLGSGHEVRELDIPEPAEGEVRVRVRMHAASVNGFDLAVAHGYLNGMMEHRFPVVLGKDFDGTVDAVGADGAGYAVGVGLTTLPEGIEFTEAGALGLAGTAALDAVDAAALESGTTVLVSGATGGVGNQVIQLALRAGARVIAAARSDEEQAQLAGLGDTETVGRTGEVAAEIRALRPDVVDVVVHLAGDAAALLPAVRAGGRFVSTLISSPEQLPVEDVTVLPIYAIPAPATLDRIAQNHATSATRVKVQRTYRLEEAPAAFADFAAGTLASSSS